MSSTQAVGGRCQRSWWGAGQKEAGMGGQCPLGPVEAQGNMQGSPGKNLIQQL